MPKWLISLIVSVFGLRKRFQNQLRKERAWKWRKKKEQSFNATQFIHDQLFLDMARPQFIYQARQFSQQEGEVARIAQEYFTKASRALVMDELLDAAKEYSENMQKYLTGEKPIN